MEKVLVLFHSNRISIYQHQIYVVLLFQSLNSKSTYPMTFWFFFGFFKRHIFRLQKNLKIQQSVAKDDAHDLLLEFIWYWWIEEIFFFFRIFFLPGFGDLFFFWLNFGDLWLINWLIDQMICIRIELLRFCFFVEQQLNFSFGRLTKTRNWKLDWILIRIDCYISLWYFINL